MNKIFIFIFISSLFLHQNNQINSGKDLAKVGAQVHQQYLNDFEEYLQSIDEFQNGLPQIKVTKTQQKWTEIRDAYKKIEHFIDHYDSLKVKYYINGAPLAKTEEHANLPNLIEAQGLQMIDEMLYEDEIDWKAVEYQIKRLKHHSNEIWQNHQQKNYHERFYFEAARRQIIRIFTLCLTNFDTPGSANGIHESTISLQSLRHYLSMHQSVIENKSKTLYDHLVFLFESSITYLQECTDFESFDHLHFYKNQLQPLYQQLLVCHKFLDIKTINELSNLPQSVTYESPFIFSDDFLNAGFYANVLPRNIAKQRANLGKLLFFDPALSANNLGACASCHLPEKAFTDGLKKSKGLVSNSLMERNSPTVINAVYADRYFWDLEESDLHKQIEKVVVNHKEMGISFPEIVEKLKQSESYQNYFKDSYPEMGVDKWSITNALINYMLTLISYNSTFDQYVRGEINALDESVIRGFNLFMGKAACATCHFPPTFSGLVPPIYYETESEVLGVPFSKDKENPLLDEDLGRYMNGRRKEYFDNYKHSFKTPSVRNVALTNPYMHNGVYDTLDEIMEFYNNGGGLGLGLNVPNQTLAGDSLHLTPLEQQDIIAFMQALTDTLHLTNKPVSLPLFKDEKLNKRSVGGKTY